MSLPLRLKIIISMLLLLIFGWIFYFNLRPNNFLLVFNPKQTTPVSPIYYLKRTREQIQSNFIFANKDKAEWFYILAQKRGQEAKILCSKGIKRAGRSQNLLAEKNLNEGNKLLNPLIDKIDTNYLQGEKLKAEELIKNACQ